MSIAAGSASEVEYQLILARDLHYMQDEKYRELNEQVNEDNIAIPSMEKEKGTGKGDVGSKTTLRRGYDIVRSVSWQDNPDWMPRVRFTM